MSSTFDKVVYKWIKDSVDLNFEGVTVIRSEQNGPRPEGDFVSYKVLNWLKSDFNGFKKSSIDDDDIKVNHFNRNLVTVSINVYSIYGREIVNDLTFSKNEWSVRRELMNSKVSQLSAGTVNDLTFLGDSDYRRRFQCDFKFLVWTEFDETRPKVNDLEISGTVHH